MTIAGWDVGKLSVIVITKNEERNLPECLESVKWADEIVVVDSASADKTVEVARRFTNKVYIRPWDGFAAAKNFALLQCTSDWVLWLDADERVTDGLAREIQDVVRQGNTAAVAFEFPRKAYFLGRWIKHCGWYPGYVVRLFRRDLGSFREVKVHESLIVEGETSRLQNDLLHYTDPNLWHYFEKFNRYTSLAAEEMAGGGASFGLGQLIIRPSWIFIRMYVIKRGFLDGVEGFILCVLSSCYVFTKYAKFWELTVLKKRSTI